jgi:ribosomal protein S18 acetylase RimI-like enzyme
MNKIYKNYLFLSLLLTGNLFASNNILEFEIVPFDYADTEMKEQLCAMVRDDQEVQQRIAQTEELFEQKISNPDVQYFICRSLKDEFKVYGFIACKLIDTFYCFKYWNGVLITQKDLVDDRRFTLLETMNKVGYIQDVVVHKNFRRQGVAQTLLLQFEEFCKQNNICKLMIRVAADNKQAIGAYKKFGFALDYAYNHDPQNYTMFKKIA